MGKITVCDRCGRQSADMLWIERVMCRWEAWAVTPTHDDFRGDYFLCPDCVKAFGKWLREGHPKTTKGTL